MSTVIARATEGQYQGLHGIESIAALEDYDESIKEWFADESAYLVDWADSIDNLDYDSDEEYEEAYDEAISECCLETYLVTDARLQDKTETEIDGILSNLGMNLFLKTYQTEPYAVKW